MTGSYLGQTIPGGITVFPLPPWPRYADDEPKGETGFGWE